MIYKADHQAADRAMNAACKRAVALIREGRAAGRAYPGFVKAYCVLVAAGTTAATLTEEA